MSNGWVVFNDATTYSSSTIDNTLWNTTITSSAPSAPARAASDDPLQWLHDRVIGVCDLGRLA